MYQNSRLSTPLAIRVDTDFSRDYSVDKRYAYFLRNMYLSLRELDAYVDNSSFEVWQMTDHYVHQRRHENTLKEFSSFVLGH